MTDSITPTSIITAFADISERLNPTNHTDILNKLHTLCTVHNISVDDLVSQYDAYKFSKQIKQQRGVTTLTTERLDAFDLYLKNLYESKPVTKPVVKSTVRTNIVSIKPSNKPIDIDELDDMLGITDNNVPMVKSEVIDVNDDMMTDNNVNTVKLSDTIDTSDMTVTQYKTPHSNKVRSFITPATVNTVHNTMFSPAPASLTALQTPSTELNDKYTQRENSGIIECTYNDSIAAAEPIITVDRPIEIHIINQHDSNKYRYMYIDDEDLRDTMHARYTTLQQTLINTVQYQQLCEQQRKENKETVIKTVVKLEPVEETKTNDDDTPVIKSEPVDDMPALQSDESEIDLESYLVPVNTRSQQNIIVAGRIVADDIDNSTGKLTTGSILLEGDMTVSHGKRVNLRLGLMTQYSLFPGQYCIVRGINETGHTLIAEQILSNAVLQHNIYSQPQLQQYNIHPNSNEIYTPMSIICAAGPYTLIDTFSYQPLYDLLDRVVQQRPHVLILIGPFVDSEHSAINDSKNEYYVTQSYDSIFYTLIDTVLSRLAEIHTKLVLVPSIRDIHHTVPVYPQPAYTCYTQWQSHIESGKLTMCANPSTIAINDITIGISSSDCLQQLAAQYELSKTDTLIKQNRMSRLMSHLLQQQSYYPVYPTITQSVDYTQQHRFDLKVTPDILILPSKIKYCANDIGTNTIGINCESVAKGTIAGFYTHITVHTLKENEVETATEHNHILARTRVDIVRV